MSLDGTYFRCEECHTSRDTYTEDTFCPSCDQSTDTVRRRTHSNNPVYWNETLSEWVTHPDSSPGWNCAECGGSIEFLRGGTEGSDGYLGGWCENHDGLANFVYADGSAGFACGECRSERESPDDVSDDPDEEVFVWKDHCGGCSNETNTVKVDASQDDIWVCEGCRTELEEPDDEDEEEECGYCEQKTKTVEIGT